MKILISGADPAGLKNLQKNTLLKITWIETVLGPMTALADEKFLYLLEFGTKKKLKQEIDQLKQKGFVIDPGDTPPLNSIKAELKAYFDGTLTEFKTPYRLLGSIFQQQVWKVLCKIPYGETRSYAEQSQLLGRPTAYRAVANANGRNQLTLLIPCHRVIASDGTLGGYGGGLKIKRWLINHEKNISNK